MRARAAGKAPPSASYRAPLCRRIHAQLAESGRDLLKQARFLVAALLGYDAAQARGVVLATTLAAGGACALSTVQQLELVLYRQITSLLYELQQLGGTRKLVIWRGKFLAAAPFGGRHGCCVLLVRRIPTTLGAALVPALGAPHIWGRAQHAVRASRPDCKCVHVAPPPPTPRPAPTPRQALPLATR